MFRIIMIVGIGVMFHNLYAMEPEERKTKGKVYLSLPDLTFSRKISPSSSPHDSPNGSTNSSPRHSPKETIKISPGRARSDSKINFQELLERQLWAAVNDNNTEKILGFIQPNLDTVNKSGKTILITAIKNKNEEIVKSLLGHKNIDLNKADKLGNTPLHHAVLACNEVIIKLLLSDCRVNSLIQNSGSFFPKKSADHDFYSDKPELKNMILARANVDVLVIDQASSLQPCQYDDTDILDRGVDFVKNLKELPAYATDEFIKNMIVYRAVELQRSKIDSNNLRISSL